VSGKRFVAVALAASAVLSGCGGGGSDKKPRLAVSAASSLTQALTSCSSAFADAKVRLEFGGSDELAARIRQGAKPDVYAAANTKLPQALHEEGRLDKPRVFANNEPVLAIPQRSSKVHSLSDVGKPGLKIAVGSPSVPVGSYTAQALSRLPARDQQGIEANIRSKEPDVKGVVGKLTQGAVDAGFVYATDVRATAGKLVAVELPARLEPTVAYGAGVVRKTAHLAAARKYVQGLVSGACEAALHKAGFGSP